MRDLRERWIHRADRCNCLYPMTFLNFEIYARFIFFLANLRWKISFWFWRSNLTVPFYSSCRGFRNLLLAVLQRSTNVLVEIGSGRPWVKVAKILNSLYLCAFSSVSISIPQKFLWQEFLVRSSVDLFLPLLAEIASVDWNVATWKVKIEFGEI